MFDLNNFVKRFFTVKLKNNKVLEVLPPKLKNYRLIASLSNEYDVYDPKNVDNIIKALSLALSNNKQNYNISEKYIEDTFTYDEANNLLIQYIIWINEVISSKN